jgi:hypothetical protein
MKAVWWFMHCESRYAGQIAARLLDHLRSLFPDRCFDGLDTPGKLLPGYSTIFVLCSPIAASMVSIRRANCCPATRPSSFSVPRSLIPDH